MSQQKTKYGSKKVEIDGHVFDSKIEARYYEQLKWLQEHNQILFFRLQPRYLLQEAFRKNGKTFRKIEYIADFEVHHLDGSIEVIDVKGMETEAFKIKRKLFEKKYPHKLSLVTYVKKYGGWIELDKLKKLRKEAKKQKVGS
jgi:ribosomal protein S24E